MKKSATKKPGKKDEVENLIIRYTADTSQLVKAIDEVEKQLKRLSKIKVSIKVENK